MDWQQSESTAIPHADARIWQIENSHIILDLKAYKQCVMNTIVPDAELALKIG